MNRKSILFVYSHFSSFVSSDYNTLSAIYKVNKYHFKAIKSVFGIGFELLRQFFFLLFNIWKYDAVFVWFADYHSFLPLLFARVAGKKSFVVNGGYDVTYLPEFNYGSFNNPIRSFFTKKTFKYATCCFPVAEALKEKLQVICPKAKAETLPTSQDAGKFNFTLFDRGKRVITLSATENHQRFMVKGLDRFRELAMIMEDFEFVVIGVSENAKHLFEPLLKNLKLLPSVPFDKLPKEFENASFYAQLSRSEGLPNALCEAMLCGCIPIGTNVGDIKITIDDTGKTVEEWKPEELALFIRENHNNNSLRLKSREQIILKYDKSIREKRFASLFD
jgi:glycosyltransferase involved in cell wall biosynthesis